MSYDLIKKIEIGDYATISLHMHDANKWEITTRKGRCTRGRYVYGTERKAESELNKEHKKVLAELQKLAKGAKWN